MRAIALRNPREPHSRGLAAWPSLCALALVRFYRLAISPALRSRCRFVPSCSIFAEAVLVRDGFWRGGWRALRRLLRCHPWGGCGYDPP